MLSSLKKWLRARFPVTYQYLGMQKAALRSRRGVARVFSDVYEHNGWGDPESLSGRGSNLAVTAHIRERLPLLVRELDIETMLDAPCGDYFWMKDVPLDLREYIGADIVLPMIERNQALYGCDRTRFATLDITTDTAPQVDLILCRDCLVHLSFEQAFAAIATFKASGSTWLLTTTFPEQESNEDIPTGVWRPLNLERPPFNFPVPTMLIKEGFIGNEGRYRDKSLGLWKLADIQVGTIAAQ